ncbi:rfaE bifunctional protein kinase chain/domain [Actimicrobium sp. GrIS 1.19]|uniref:D-glycero-beta-D-manno-heptose-7-phosphate kinase n=1 Tax=Actimicrobium sp. GrIS 1.19 TaxID=3071708 RepID=UPI002DFAF91B|nr:rfaE bifunctional protein kinase chain/domain [Actimicrobium sp. GrIS 1.19]
MNDLAAFSPGRILVAGDIMLDRYWFGEVNRISPEAPVPIVRVQRTEERLGGAANVARNAASLGANVGLLGVVGDDEAGRLIEGKLAELDIGNFLQRDSMISTIVKLRVIGRQQQLLRIDFESPPGQVVLREKLMNFNALLPEYSIIVMSDYAKGSLVNVAEMIATATRLGKRTLVDPKGDDFSRYAGATLLTPNKAEFRQVVGAWRDESEFVEKAQRLRVQLRLEALLVTRSEEGMTLITGDKTMHFPTQAREVFDVSGAGDTVMATMAVMLSAGKTLPEAVQWANKAGGIVVGKLGTATVTREELFA